MVTQLTGQVVLITGGSRGVGLAIAQRLARREARVVLVARDPGRLHGAAESIRAFGGSVLDCVADVRDHQAMAAATRRAEAAFGGIDTVIINAAFARYAPVGELSLDLWREMLDVNLTGAFITTQVALPALRRRGGGRIVAISSDAGRRGVPTMTAYCASKHGLQGFMAALESELSDEPILCTTIVPGPIATDFGVRSREQRLQSGGRFLEPDDVAAAVEHVLEQPGRAWTRELVLWPR